MTRTPRRVGQQRPATFRISPLLPSLTSVEISFVSFCSVLLQPSVNLLVTIAVFQSGRTVQKRDAHPYKTKYLTGKESRSSLHALSKVPRFIYAAAANLANLSIFSLGSQVEGSGVNNQHLQSQMLIVYTRP
jgi:hypothetical protein